MCWNLEVLVTALATELRTSWRRCVCVAGRLNIRESQLSFLEWMRKVAMIQAVVWSIALRIRLRFRILRKRDLKIKEICCANNRFLSKITPRLRKELTGESMTLLGRWMVWFLSLESYCGRLKMRNSVLEGLRDRKLDDIQLDMLFMVFSRRVMLWEKSIAENDKRSWVSLA